MYVFFYSKYSSKSIEVMNAMDDTSKKRIKFISVDDARVREHVSKYIKEVPCMVIKEGEKTYVCDYATLKETFKSAEGKLSFSNSEAPSLTNTNQKKLDMNRVLRDMKAHEDEVNRANKHTTEKHTLSNIENKSSSMFSQYAGSETEDPAPVTNVSDISNFFKFQVSDKRDTGDAE